MSDSTVPPAREEWSFEQRLIGVAGHVGALPRGPQAVLRRIRQHAGEPPPAPFWDIIDRYHLSTSEQWLPFWLAVIPLMVVHPHRAQSPGRALKEAGVSDARVERWLRQSRERAWAEAWRLLSKLKQQRLGFHWARFGWLLYAWDDDQKRRLAQDFYLGRGYSDRAGDHA